MSFEPLGYDLGGARAGDVVTVRGSVRTSFDGTVFDATTHTDTTGAHVGGLYALDGTGLRVAEQHTGSHEIALVVTGDDGPACHAAGLASPCLLPRTSEIAHERLLTVKELEQTLTGDVQVVVPPAPPPPIVDVPPSTLRAVGLLGALALVAFAAFAALRARSAKRATAIGQVLVAADDARRRTADDPTLASLRAQIEGLVREAKQVESGRQACARKLARVDRAAMAKKRVAWASSAQPVAQATSAWIAAEEREAERLASAHESALAALEQIASSLRVVSLRADGGDASLASAQSAIREASERLHDELTFRDDAMAEAERSLV